MRANLRVVALEICYGESTTSVWVWAPAPTATRWVTLNKSPKFYTACLGNIHWELPVLAEVLCTNINPLHMTPTMPRARQYHGVHFAHEDMEAHREVNWLTQSHRAFKHWHLRFKSSLSDSDSHTSPLRSPPQVAPCRYTVKASIMWKANHIGARAPKTHPCRSFPKQDLMWGHTLFSCCRSIQLEFSGVAAERVANRFSFHWLLGDFMAKTMLPLLPDPTHNPHPYAITNRKRLTKFPSVAEAGLKVKQTLAHLLFTISCPGRC